MEGLLATMAWYHRPFILVMLFGLLAVEIAVEMKEAAHTNGTQDYTAIVGVGMLLIALVFVWRSFYAMRIPQEKAR